MAHCAVAVAPWIASQSASPLNASPASSRLTVRSLRDPATNLAVGAALLQMWERRHKEIDEGFGGVPHRSGLAHMVWGDEVRSSGQEDHLLTVRRRMVQRYLGTIQLPRPMNRGQADAYLKSRVDAGVSPAFGPSRP